jgi:hypothetical protein
MPSWKKILQSGSAAHVTNITASSLPNSLQPNVIGYDTASGRFTFFSTASLTSSFVGGSGTTNYITRWSGPNTITTSSMYESSSRIGIGTITPQGPLHIRGTSVGGVTPTIFLDTNGTDSNEPVDIRLASGSARGIRIIASSSLSSIPGGASIQFYSNNSATFGGQFYIDSGNTGSSAIIFRTNNTLAAVTERMRIAGNGTVSITGSGPTSATTILSIVDSTPTTRFTILGDGTSAFNTNHLYISGSGLVGIGTTLPSAKLHIYTNQSPYIGLFSRVENTSGTTIASASAIQTKIDSTSGTITNAYNINILNSSGSEGAISNLYGVHINLLNSGSNNWAIFTSGSTRSYFGGNVGLNVTAPT